MTAVSGVGSHHSGTVVMAVSGAGSHHGGMVKVTSVSPGMGRAVAPILAEMTEASIAVAMIMAVAVDTVTTISPGGRKIVIIMISIKSSHKIFLIPSIETSNKPLMQ